jgi:hypothetical protein
VMLWLHEVAQDGSKVVTDEVHTGSLCSQDPVMASMPPVSHQRWRPRWTMASTRATRGSDGPIVYGADVLPPPPRSDGVSKTGLAPDLPTTAPIFCIDLHLG